MKYNGFTLAEVLITLVIIGVIAAMTIPTLINKMQDQEMKSQFAKAYTTVSQAVYKTNMMDFGGAVDCYYIKENSADSTYRGSIISQCPVFFDAFVKNLQVEKKCNGNSKADGCVPTYQSYNTSEGCPGFSQSYIDNNAVSYILSNGQIIIVYTIGTSQWPLFLIDINGEKGPNAYGKDLFGFAIDKFDDSGLYINRAQCDFPISGGRSTREMIKYSVGGKR